PAADRHAERANKRFNAELKKQHMTLKSYKERIRKDLSARKFMEEKLRQTVKPVEEADAKALFDRVEMVLKNNTKKIKALEKENPAQLQEAQLIAAKLKQLTAERVRVGHIYLAVTKDMKPEEVKKKEELAKQIKKELDEGLDFSTAVQKYTEDKSSLASGGDMILVKGTAPKEIDAKAFTLAVGKVSAPIKTDLGYHIIKIKEKRAEKTIAFNDVSQDLAQYLAQQRVQEAMGNCLEELYNKADVKITKTFEVDKVIAEKQAAAAQQKKADEQPATSK
ncbi:MAG: peptidyl-prolyl cis-trans isomerase, partial [Elusimicrobiaceae bacterium]|nr:peptidyl-prolyl cis-trans isomerase [Elusimicrobiaceae bacterium]